MSDQLLNKMLLPALEQIDEIADNYDIPIKTRHRAAGMATRAMFVSGVSRAPESVGAASIYLASVLDNQKLTQCAVAQSAGITTITLRDTYVDIVDAEEMPIRDFAGTAQPERGQLVETLNERLDPTFNL